MGGGREARAGISPLTCSPTPCAEPRPAPPPPPCYTEPRPATPPPPRYAAPRPVSVSSVASGGHANRTGVYLLVPQPAETCR